ncbi:MAG: sulfatase [Niabella sp.]
MPKVLQLIFLAVVLLSSVTYCQKSSEKKYQRPNIIYIMSDDHTAQAWGIYGGILKDYIRNPHIDRLAKQGAVLENVFCTNSICVPSRATVLTGQYSNNNGVYTLSDALDPDKDNIAKRLQQAGYQTAIFGKWHLKKQPSGFDTFAVLPGQGVYHDPTYLTPDYWNDNEAAGIQQKGFVDDITTDMSINWMKKTNKNEPFFLMCHFKSTHEPFDFADRFKNLYEDVAFPYPAGFNDSGASSTGRSFPGQPLEELGRRYMQASVGSFWTSYPGLPFSVEGLNKMEARKKIYQKFIRDYLRCGAGIDDNIGKILDYVKAAGITNNTVIIYTADQGYFLGEHDFMDKRLMYEQSLRMPFVICYPKEIKGGTHIKDMVLNIDFAALFADYAGLKKPDFIQGKSFRKNLQGHTSKKWRSAMYYRYWQHWPIRPAHYGIRNNRYKLIYFYGNSMGMTGSSDEATSPAWEFYDLKTDPGEMHNAINKKEYQKAIRKMKKQLLQLKAVANDTIGPQPVSIF